MSTAKESVARDDVFLRGYADIVLHDEATGELKHFERVANGITQVGDQYWGERASGIASPPNQVSGMRLGTGTTAFAETGAGAAIVTYITTSQKALDGGYPTSALSGTSRRITWQASWAAGTATNAAITEAVITNEATLTDVAGTAANTIARIVFTAVNKTATDSLTITWQHDVG